ncbi:hypothetical protein ARAM_003031 [Aspergillus rambellii]|uniref:PH domain-containing protein n=1 Tax=Aspergillus rambellii TaxID=308745 RepID=A0A0F8UT67_9EURO|nr:hypothetical protein ARAM_003031 [Aspergillus rambellii]
MVRSRVLSLLSSFGGSSRKTSPDNKQRAASASYSPPSRFQTPSPETPLPLDGSPTKAERRLSPRPASTVFSSNPPFMALEHDTPAELQPIFTYLNSHTNKLYYEGYFLKLNDLDNNGRPAIDRQWMECYAQLIGTVLSLWDAAALDAAGDGFEVPPTFINLTDASIQMIETLPTQNQTGAQSLQNVLSISSAGQNRYLLHFESLDSLTQWTAAIRLAMFEHTSLYEAYTGSIIAGKGKTLNGIGAILERNRFKHQDWARVRFGAGTPWRRCWFVITPPDEKELQKTKKSMKKKSAYDRAPKLVIGDIKFYETKKTKKVKPIATITDAYSAYAIYPQSKALIDQSTLVKIEGNFIMHAQSEAKTEGFVFVMPEAHPAVSGFEIMLRFLVPTFDTFNLYGRPTRLIAAVNHIKSIMFAFPDQDRYDYLEIMDIANEIQSPGSQNWSEAEWRKKLKEATANRMANAGSRTSSMSASKARFRASMPSRYSNVRVDSIKRKEPFPEYLPSFNQSVDAIVRQVPEDEAFAQAHHHARSASDTAGFAPRSLLSSAIESTPSSSAHDLTRTPKESPSMLSSNDRTSSEEGWKQNSDPETEIRPEEVAVGQRSVSALPPSSVAPPPAFTHNAREMPSTRPEPSPDMRKATNRMSNATLAQLAAASGKMNLIAESAGHSDTQLSALEELPHMASHGPDLSDMRPSSRDQTAIAQEQSPNGPEHNSAPLASPSPRVNRLSTQSLLIDTTKAVKRKPVSQPPVAEPSYDDLRHTVDEDAFNMVGIVHPSFLSPIKATHQEEESVYDDDSTTSPDYASTGGSIYSKNSVKSIPKPRMGVMKTVGALDQKDVVIGDAHYSLQKESQQNSDIPTVDFGPTLTYLPTTGRPSTSDTLKKFDHQRTKSDATEKQQFADPTSQMDRTHSRSPSGNEYRRSVLWQPGMAAPRPVTPGSLTPEQFVQQRAAHSPQVHIHHRSPSGATATTPPPARPLSADWMAHTRSQSQTSMNRDIHPRPRSRGASSMINDISSHLSAREQEHVARMTGSSFFNLSSENKKTPAPVNPMGLVGAIDAREQEKQMIKEGMSNQMVQHAIAQRQHHWQQQQLTPQIHSYGVQAGQGSIYNMPTASRTWDALNQSYRPEEPRRPSWYSQYPVQPLPMTPGYQPNQPNQQQHPGYFGNASMHY